MTHAAKATVRPARAAGFTLIELMIVVVVASILLAIAIPSYQAQIRKSRRTDARTALMDLAAREQRYFSLQGTFTNSPANLGYAPPASNATFPMNVGSGYYSVNVTLNAAGNPPSFSFTATPVAGTSQANDTQCASFTVTNTGSQTSVDNSNNDTTSTCWGQ